LITLCSKQVLGVTNKYQIKISVIKSIAIWIVTLLFSASYALAQSDILSPQAEAKAYQIGDIILSKNLVTEDISSISELDFSNKSHAEIIEDLLYYANGVATLSNSLNASEILELYEKAILEHGNKRDKSVFDLYKLYLTTIDLLKQSTQIGLSRIQRGVYFR